MSLPVLDPRRRSLPPLGGFLVLLWILALILALSGLDTQPLRDWDEGIVARVSLEASWMPWPDRLLPTFWGSDYHNKPPGLHWLIAAAFQLWRGVTGQTAEALPPEWLVRLVPAALSSAIVPLVGLLQLRLRPGDPRTALCSAVIALTLLPLARHGRLAMLDGVQLCAMTALWLGLLHARGGRRRAMAAGLIAGLAGSALLLLKAPVLLPVLVSGVALRWLDRDLSRAAWSGLALGLALGLFPGLAWHGWHLLQRGDEALVMWGRQGLSRFTTTVEKHSGGPIEPLLEVLEGGWPWLPLWPLGFVMAWRCRFQACGRWSLGLTLTTALMVLPMKTQLPWYSLLLWPPFCLICAPPLAALLDQFRPRGLLRLLPWFWTLLGGVLLLTALATLLPAAQSLIRYRALPVPAGLGLLSGGLLLSRHSAPLRRRGLMALTAGWCLSLLLFFHSTLWNWELNERWSVLPVAELARGVVTPAGQPAPAIFMAGNASQRPSLRWYAGRELFRLPGENAAEWPERFFLIHREGEEEIRLPPDVRCRIEAQGAEGWQRWRCAKP